MIVAIVNGHIIAHADTTTECAEAVMDFPRRDPLWHVQYRPASPALQALLESGASTEGLDLVIGDTADLAPSDEDIRRIREHVLAKALENTK